MRVLNAMGRILGSLAIHVALTACGQMSPGTGEPVGEGIVAMTDASADTAQGHDSSAADTSLLDANPEETSQHASDTSVAADHVAVDAGTADAQASMEPCSGTNHYVCNGRCTDTSSDPSNCGACGHGCDGVCYYGTCKCTVGYTACTIKNGHGTDVQCTSLLSDWRHCGACENVCPNACSNGHCI